MTQITIDASNDLPILQNNLEQLSERINQKGHTWAVFMEAIGNLVVDGTMERFINRTAPNGAGWANLLPSTLAQKTNVGTASNNKMGKEYSAEVGILVEYGDLFGSMEVKVDAYSITIGTPEEYGKYLQTGTNKMVARPFLGLSDEDKRDIEETIADYLLND